MGPQAARITGQSPGGQGVQSLGSPASLASTAGQQRGQFPVTGPHIHPLQAQGLCPGRPWIWLWVTSPQGGLCSFPLRSESKVLLHPSHKTQVPWSGAGPTASQGVPEDRCFEQSPVLSTTRAGKLGRHLAPALPTPSSKEKGFSGGLGRNLATWILG